MRNILSIGLIAALLFSVSCRKAGLKGEGSTISETRSVSSFNTVLADGDIDVDVYPSNENKVIVTGYSNLVGIFTTDVSGDRLRLKFRDGYINIRNNNIHVAVYTKQLHGVQVNGSGNMSLHDSIKSDRMDAEVNGSGNIYIGNNGYYVMDLNVNGSGDINASACTTSKAYAKISGSGNIKMRVTDLLEANISGSGDIEYWGDPKTVNTNISGSGKVIKQ